jgi:coenzyme F420-reducing hydrogenase alpha subunit
MIMISFKNKRDREHLLEKAKKMEEYASMIVECIEESDHEYNERSYHITEEDREDRERDYDRDYDRMPERHMGRYGYRGRMR